MAIPRHVTAGKHLLNLSWKQKYHRLPIWLLLLGMGWAQAAPPPRDVFESKVLPALHEYCGNCHAADSDNKERFLSASSVADLNAARRTWRNVANQLSNRTMPPVDEPQPTEAARLEISEWIRATLQATANTGHPFAGVVTARRLNRREYANTIRDLAGVELDFATTLPVDSGGGEGFDNNGETLFLPPLLLERYIEAAQRIVDAAIIPPRTSTLFRPTEMLPRLEGAEKSRTIKANEIVSVLVPIPVEGDYRIPTGIVPLDEGDLEVTILVDGIAASELTYRRYGQRGVANQEEAKLRLTRGLHLIGVQAPNEHDVEIVRMRVELIPPATTPVQSVNHFRLLGVQPGQVPVNPEHSAKRTIRRFGSRAFRRPLTEAEQHRFFQLYERGVLRDDSYEECVKLALKGILVSPEFLFRLEAPPESHEIEPLSDHELATRLSYFLWSTMPDDELNLLARRRALSDPTTLKQQLNRMLDDPRSDEFFKTFIGQWLGTRDLGGRRAATENSIQDKYTPFIAADMRKQPVLLFEHIIRDNRSVLELLDADYTFVTKKLARFYGMEQAESMSGDGFEQISLDQRAYGGLLGQGAVLALTSHIASRETSPVLRGAWVLETLLGVRIPAPPEDVPALDRKRKRTEKLTLRETLEFHREAETCAACHRLMDPIGFGLENFDFLGRWRTEENGRPIDATGIMPTGETFRGPQELKKILMGRKDEFVRQLIRKLLGYALGRSLEEADEFTIDQLCQQLKRDNYRGHALLESIILSVPFRNRSLRRPHEDFLPQVAE